MSRWGARTYLILSLLLGTSAVFADEPKGRPKSSKSKTIILPHDDPDFPAAEGREIFMSRCTVCHSLRYISMQPHFSEKTWQKEVEKMKVTWGAHMTESEAKQIVAYLVRIKGKEAQHAGK